MRAVLLLILIALAGCGNSNDSKVVGDWVGEFKFSDGKTKPGANLTFDKDHHWRELYGNLEVSGIWELVDHTLTLKTEKVAGLPVAEAMKKMLAGVDKSSDPIAARSMAENLDRPMKLNLAEDGASLTQRDVAAGGTVEYKKH